MLNWFSSACIVWAVYKASLYVNSTISMELIQIIITSLFSPKVVIKLKCPFCDSTYPSHNDFYVHLCDTHFKEKLTQDLPPVSPFHCPGSKAPALASHHLGLRAFSANTLSPPLLLPY